jgi:hypothetical protein
MKRTLALIGVVLVVGSCAAGAWRAADPPLAPFLLPGATNIQVVEIGMGERQITYRSPAPPYDWYFTLARQLEDQGWTLRNRWRPDGPTPTYDPLVPLWFEREYAGVLWEEVLLAPDRGDPQRATVRWRISIPWWRTRPPSADHWGVEPQAQPKAISSNFTQSLSISCS